MKILFVASYYLPYVSGLTIHAQRLAEGLADKGHEIKVICNNHKNFPREETLNKVLIKRAKPIFRLSRGFVSFDLFKLFLRELPGTQVVVLHLPMPEAFVFASLAKLFGKKVFLIYHANLNLPTWSGFSKIIENIVLINHLIAGVFASRIIAYSQDYANFATFLKIFKKKIAIVSPPVVMAIPDLEKSEKWKEKLGLTKYIVIGFAGRFAEEKGGDLLIESVPYLVKNIPGIKVVFAGETNLIYEDFYRRKKDLVDKYKKRIIFLGPVPPKEMSEFFSMCDVLALPSRAECFGLVQVEAMLCGTPVVAFNIPGGRVPILKTGMGKVVRTISAEGLAEGIIEVVRNKKNFVKKKEIIEDIFSFKKTIDDYEKVFSSV